MNRNKAKDTAFFYTELARRGLRQLKWEGRACSYPPEKRRVKNRQLHEMGQVGRGVGRDFECGSVGRNAGGSGNQP